MSWRSREIDVGHLLLGLLTLRTGVRSPAPAGVIAPLLDRVSADAQNDLRAEIRAACGGNPGDHRAELPFAAHARAALDQAGREADVRQEESIGTAHLLLALVLDSHTSGAAFLAAHGVRREDVERALAGQRPAMLTVEASPVPAVSLEPYHPAAHPAFVELLDLPPLRGQGGEAVLTNHSSRLLTAAMVRRIAADAKRSSTLVYDQYFIRPDADGLAPGEQLLVFHSGFSKPISGVRVGMALGRRWSDDDDPVDVTVTLDSAVFEDGLLVGPDAYGIARHLHGLYAAAQSIVARVRQAEAVGEDVRQVLEAIANSRPEGDDKWRVMFAMRALRSPDVGWLERMRQPLQLWR